MSHELANLIDGSAAMGYREDKGKPWHGLGVPFSADTPLETWKDRVFPWQLRKAPALFAPVGADKIVSTTAGECVNSTGSKFLLDAYEDKRIVYRTDNGQPLSIVGKGYKLVQPREVIDFFASLIADQGFELETAGALKDGRIYWALARTGQTANIGGDEHRAYTMLATSCDGSMSNTARLTDVRVVCWNTLSYAEASRSGGVVKTRHSSEFNADEFKRRLGLIDFEKSWFQEVTDMEQLVATPVTPIRAAAYTVELAGNDEGKAELAKQLAPETSRIEKSDGGISYSLSRARGKLDDLKAEMASKIAELERAGAGQPLAESLVDAGGQASRKLWNTIITGKGQDTKAARGTAYGLLNGATRWIDHERASDDGKRMASAQFGDGLAKKRTARELALELVA